MYLNIERKLAHAWLQRLGEQWCWGLQFDNSSLLRRKELHHAGAVADKGGGQSLSSSLEHLSLKLVLTSVW